MSSVPKNSGKKFNRKLVETNDTKRLLSFTNIDHAMASESDRIFIPETDFQRIPKYLKKCRHCTPVSQMASSYIFFFFAIRE